MIRHLRLTSAALFVLAVGGSSAFAQTEPKADAPPELPPPAVEAAPPPAPEPPPTPPPPPPAPAVAPKGTPPFKLEAGGNSIKVGLLLQPQYQAAQSATMAQDGFSQNLYLRRTRLLVGGTLFGAIDYFVETDFANLMFANTVNGMDAMGNATMTSVKATPGMNIQDAFATWKALGDMIKLDVGYMLPPLVHNSVQGAGTLLGLDYFANAFRATNSFSSVGVSAGPAGRDTGLQLRGLVIDGHLEYRFGLFQGLRSNPNGTEVGSKNFFRFAGRLQVNLLDAETGFFYAGTYLGTKKIVSLGASVDIQDAYKYYGGDLFVDYPLGPGVLSAQVNYAQWDGGSFAPIPKQHAISGEIGYLISAAMITPMFRFEQLKLDSAANPENRISGGAAWWPYGHNCNLKVFVTQTDTGNSANRKPLQANLQWQVYYF